MVSPSPELRWIRRPLIDGAGNSCADLEDVLSKLDGLLAECSKVLVHCREGISRTPFIVACHLDSTTHESLDEILEGFSKKLGYVSVDAGLLQTWSECRQVS